MVAGKDKGRLEVVDAIRALALFGVLVMNLRDMSGLNFVSQETLAILQGPTDQIVDLALSVFFDEKFLSAFSFLFGLSFFLLLERKSDKAGFLAMYFRRLLALAGFGLLNMAFFYWADILLMYAIYGSTMVLMVRLPQRALLALSAVFLLGAPVVLALLGAVAGLPGQTEYDLIALHNFGSPDYWTAVRYGFLHYFGVMGKTSLVGMWNHTNVYGMLLLGLWAGRKQIPHRIDENRGFLRRIAVVCIPLGLIVTLLWVTLPGTSVVSTLMRTGAPILSVGYMALAMLLLSRPRAQRVRELLAAPGRLALTNYLTYGLLGQVLFYGWGLGWIGNVDSTSILLVAVMAYIVLSLLSLLSLLSWAWLKPFSMGPMEWLWRCLTYLRLEPIWRRR